MPVVDLKSWVEYNNGIPKIAYTFYKKPILSPFTIMKRSAVSERTKKSMIFQEGITSLSHVASWLPWKKSIRHMSEWSNTLTISGYTEMERYNAVIGAVTRQEKIKRMVTEGEISSLHRNKEEILSSNDKDRSSGFHKIP